MNFGQKSPRGRMSIPPPPPSRARGLKDDMVEILNCTEMENCIYFWAERCRKYALFQKKLQIKIVQHRILDKEVRKGICLSPPGVELGGSKDDMVEILNCTETQKYIHIFLWKLREFFFKSSEIFLHV